MIQLKEDLGLPLLHMTLIVGPYASHILYDFFSL